jgi:hypothetical protein
VSGSQDVASVAAARSTVLDDLTAAMEAGHRGNRGLFNSSRPVTKAWSRTRGHSISPARQVHSSPPATPPGEIAEFSGVESPVYPGGISDILSDSDPSSDNHSPTHDLPGMTDDDLSVEDMVGGCCG